MSIKIRRSPIFVIILLVAFLTVVLSIYRMDTSLLIYLASGFTLLFGVCTFYLIRCYFVFEDNAFRYVFGFRNKSIPYNSIHSVGLSEDSSASPAWTTTRIEIISNKGRVLLSLPSREDTPEFIKKIKENCTNAKIDLDKLPLL
ncbi:PH domain-containing protein [Paenibacillus sp. FSL R7-0179]|uniref:PH domain-containing protein n=1 Tax=Paenibacillus sp. FSL R7-0179 TaxID=2921672 RepID=UPI0030FACF10